MPKWTMSHTWETGGELPFSVLTAVDIAGDYPRAVKETTPHCWVVDYEFRSFGRTRVRAKRMKWLDRSPRTLHLYPPGSAYWEDTRKESGWRHSAWIDFHGGDQAGLQRLVQSEHGYASFLDPLGRAGEVFHRAAESGHYLGEAGFWQAQSCLCLIIDMLMQAQHVEEQVYRIVDLNEPPPGSDFVRTVQDFLRKRIGHGTTLADIADAAHVSVSTLCHRYRREAGETPMATFNRLRIAQAKSLLVKGHSLKAIADQLDYSDAFHLSKAFKRAEGISPREFMKRRRQTAQGRLKGLGPM